jgi:hypothetical protein
MLLKGKRLQEPNKVNIYIPRGESDEDTIVLTAQAIMNFDEFNRLYPEPKAPVTMAKGGEWRPDHTSDKYKDAMKKYGEMQHAYILLKSLQATEGLEWEKVNIDDPETWLLWKDELREAGFSEIEMIRIVQGIQEANSLSDEKIKKARESFLAGRAPRNGSLPHSTEPYDMPSGEPVND